MRLLILLTLSSALFAQTQSSSRINWRVRAASDPLLTSDQRWEMLLRTNFFSPEAGFRTLMPALISHARDVPVEWERNGKGFARRLGTQFTIQTSRTLIHAGGSALLKRDPRYQRCGCTGGWRRAGHAFSGLFLSADSSGVRRPNPTLVLAGFGAGYLGAGMYPDRYRVAVKGYQLGLQQTGQLMMQNVLLEFGPELPTFFKKKILRR